MRTLIAGAFTGALGAEMLKDASASAVIVRHSERRQYKEETDERGAAKAKAAQGFWPLFVSARRNRSARRVRPRQFAATRSPAEIAEVHARILTTRRTGSVHPDASNVSFNPVDAYTA